MHLVQLHMYDCNYKNEQIYYGIYCVYYIYIIYTKIISKRNEIIIQFYFYCEFTENSNKTWPSKFSEEEINLCKELLSTNLEHESLVIFLKHIQNDGLTIEKIGHIAVCTLLSFCDNNWNTKQENFDLESYFNTDWPKDIDVQVNLQRDSEPLFVNILYPELLYFSTQVLEALQSLDQNMVIKRIFNLIKKIVSIQLFITSCTCDYVCEEIKSFNLGLSIKLQ